MKYGAQAHIARATGIAPHLINHYLTGRKNASALVADRLAILTGTDIRIWLQGGDVNRRREAVAAWTPNELGQ